MDSFLLIRVNSCPFVVYARDPTLTPALSDRERGKDGIILFFFRKMKHLLFNLPLICYF